MPVENQFERQLQQKLQDARMEPKPEVWQQLASQMAANRRRRVIGFWTSAGIAAALLLFAAWRFSLPAPEARAPLADVTSPARVIPAPGDNQSISSGVPHDQDIQQMTGANDVVGIANSSDQAVTNTSTPMLVADASLHSETKKFEVNPLSFERAPLLESKLSSPVYLGTEKAQLTDESVNVLASIEVPEYILTLKETSVSSGSIIPTSNLHRPNKWAWKASIMPQWQLKDLSVFQTTEIETAQLGIFNEVVTADVTFPVLSYSASLAMEYFVSPSLSLEAQGMVISSRQRWNVGLEDEAVVLNSQSPRWFEPARYADITYTSVRVPVLLNRYFHKGRSSLILSGGLGWDVVVASNQDPESSSDSRIATPSAPITNKIPLSTHQFSGIARAHYQYRLGSFAALQMGPTFTRGFLPTFAETNLSDERPFQLGVELGVKFFPGT
ncbi:MAG: hypothetical protein AAGI38_01685 [Bacteroidota bacterium]